MKRNAIVRGNLVVVKISCAFVFVVVRDETIYEIECREKRARGERRERKRDGSFSESDRGGTN